MTPHSIPRPWLGPTAWSALLCAVYMALAIGYTWPLAGRLSEAIPSDLGDPVLNTWILWWNARQLPLTEAYWNAPAFYPATGALAFSETLLGLSVISSPLQWLGAGPQLAYNLTFLVSFPLCGLCTAWLVRELTGRRDAAFLSGLVFAFHPYRAAHLPHIQVLSTYTMPLVLFALHRHVREPRKRWLALFALGFAMLGLTNGYYLLYFTLCIGVWLSWCGVTAGWRRLLAMCVAWAAGFAALAPVVLRYLAIHRSYGLGRDASETIATSADLCGILCASPRLRIWGNLHLIERFENELFPGLTLVALILAGCIVAGLRFRSVVAIPNATTAAHRAPGYCWLMAIACWSFTLGPVVHALGDELPVPGPFRLLQELPGFAGVRAPSRSAALMMLYLSVLGGFAFAALASKLGSWRIPVLALLGTGVLADAWLREMPLARQPDAWGLQMRGERVPVLELPSRDPVAQGLTMYRSMAADRPVVNGHSGYYPPHHFELWHRLRQHDPEMLDALASFGPIDIVVAKARDQDGAVTRYVATRNLESIESSATHARYRLPASASADPRLRDGPRCSFTATSEHAADLAKLSDGDPTTRWTPGPQDGKAQQLVLDLGQERRLRSVLMVLGPYRSDHPRHLRIEVSRDGRNWEQAFHGPTGGECFAARIREPRRVPLCFALGGRTARWIRLRNTGRNAGGIYWSIGELEVVASDP
ncbi:MAG: discoidin domain-containing protein [Planctomycetes bacterium]|nr:discoidin domain-containing protein [Planctomycetota bacterium]